ncbi:MAG TPA: NAD+ synthase [Candidatus Bathyarchaeia archaeon]|nr:NAD+ synthase [Candidatus Bathyarchaeia archaeon]
MQLNPDILEINPEETKQKIARFIKDYVVKTKSNGVVLGMSGGIDSSMNAALAALAIGGNRTYGLLMPEKETESNIDINHARQVARQFKIRTTLIDITKILDSLYEAIPDFKPSNLKAKGNLKARTRMILLYYYANERKLIVAGSSDKSETMIGYYTKFGDIAADITPQQDLYKTQVRQLATYMGIAEAIITKPSTPSLWPNQTAEKEIGITYEKLDLVLYGLEHFMQTSRIAEQLLLPTKTVESIKKRWLNAEHKRRMPLTPKLAFRTVGKDFRLPYDNM